MIEHKVAILTQPLGHNYGGLLQAYALQTYLKRLGCNVETIDRRTPQSPLISARVWLLNLAKFILGNSKSIPTAKKQERVLEELTRFRSYRITMSPKITNEQELRNYCKDQNFSAFVVGSDQVWRPRYSPSIQNFFLDFLSDIPNPGKRIAYAASFGVDTWEYSAETTIQCKAFAKKFNAISVRETSAVVLCEKWLDVSATCVVDPTLLLEPSDYDLLINECGESSNTDCMLSYILDPALEKKNISEKVSTLLGLRDFSIKPELSISQVANKNLDICRLPSVESWLQAFRDSRFVVTDSFHGTVFSILFNKPFIAVENPTRGMARFESLLSQFGLAERLVKSPDEVTPELTQQEIDWATVNIRREALADVGRNFLKTHLSNE